MDRRRPVSNHVFSFGAWSAWFALALIAVSNLETASMGLVSPSLDVRIVDVYNFLSVPKVVLEAMSACLVVDWIFKRFGHSSSGKVVEIRGPTRPQPAAGGGKSDVLELPCATPVAQYTAYCLGVFCLGTAAAPIIVLLGSSRDGAAIFGGMSPLAVLAGLCLCRFRGPYVVRVDPSGVTGPPYWAPFRRKYVPWSEVVTCDIVTYYTAFGRRWLIVPVFRDGQGRSRLSLGMFPLSPTDLDRLLVYIRSKFEFRGHEFGNSTDNEFQEFRGQEFRHSRNSGDTELRGRHTGY
jgi:hypothetical protein